MYFFKFIKCGVFYISFTFISSICFSQTGTISGKITDIKTNEALVGVNVIIQGTYIGSTTDFNGEFKILQIKPGTYNLICSYISYKTKIIEKVKVSAGMDTKIIETMEESVIALKGIVITGKKVTNTDIALLNKMKSSNLVISGVSSQWIGKTLDKDASEVIKRVPGVTIIDGRFVMVRGLNERYNTVMLNGASTPSSEPDVKAFSFDVIPASLIDNLLIYKTAAPELPADFTGASIQIFTKNVPDNNSISLSYFAGFRQGTTFKEFYSCKGGKYDWLGFSDGNRSLPEDFPSANEFIALVNSSLQKDKNTVTELGQKLNKNWTTDKFSALPDVKLSFGITHRFNIKKATLGNITSLNYGISKQNLNVTRADYQAYDTINDKSVLYYQYADNIYSNNVKISALHNWSLAWGKNNKIDFRNLFNQIATDKTTIRNGREYYGGNTIRAYEFKYQKRTIYSGQLGGIHQFNDENTRLTWILGFAYANRIEPDIKRLSFTKVEEDPSDPHYGMYALQFFFSASPEKVGRVFLDMNEKILSASANFEHKFMRSKFNPELKFGFNFERKRREFSARNIGYKMANTMYFNNQLPFMPIENIFINENINDSNGIKLDEKTNASDAYTASNDLMACYIGLKFQILKKSILYLGVRFEKNTQTLSSYMTDDPSKSVYVDLDTLNFFPSVNFTYNLNKYNLIRIAWGITTNRPEFREIAPMLFYDFEAKAGIRGNINLKNAYINNYDIRYEFYPSPSEIITFGCFYKSFVNPIELHVLPAGTGLEYSFRNADKAYSIGAELDIRKTFEKWGKKKNYLKIFKDFSLVFNGSLIKSRVEFAKGTLEQDRPLQGQSPFIVNSGLFYQNDTIKLTISLLYNIIGKRVVFAGDPYTGNPDVYEMPRNSLDLLIAKNLGKHFQVKFGVQDIFNDEIIYKQTIRYNKDVNADGKGDGLVSRDEVKLNYKPGRYFSLGITFIY